MDARKPRYMNPYTDFGFKRLFGVEANRDLLIDFLNQVLPPEHNIDDLQFRNPENHSDLPFLRKAIFDIQCRGRNGENIIIEMQKEKIQFFKDRSLFAVTFPIQEQAKKDRWDFKLSHIYLIAVLDFEYDEREEKRKFERYVQLKDQDGDLFYSKLHFKFLQMPLFTKAESELKTRFDKWCYFLKNLESFNEIPAILNEPIFERAFRTSEVSAMSREEYDIYMESLMSYWESQGMLDTARTEAEIKGRNEEKVEVALNGIRLGLPDKTIQELTGLSEAEIKKLRATES